MFRTMTESTSHLQAKAAHRKHLGVGTQVTGEPCPQLFVQQSMFQPKPHVILMVMADLKRRV